ncbi:putative argonaute sirna chaperone arc complex subunit arb1 [Erysiphe neolycopersici]|uniref:Putative argonaute sirna chaperone arc complex subunit arb1 n=1 Tax=Erysiphe neolycopersici TaxID=212602 RepID=A0A420HWH9_9PEZI|nr:putative argonaute sirna chaperone arc complex subunit arb1 [Erysiphe neolycopersici]
MDSQQEAQLSRAVSAVDLNASLTAMQEKPQKCYNYSEANTPNSQLDSPPEIKLASSVSASGVSTPLFIPNPPPPTPATVDITVKSSDDVAEPSGDTAEIIDVDIDQPVKKKKKKKKNKAPKATTTQNGPTKPRKPQITGFEEFFADAPIHPDEYAEELDLYDQSREFKERMQSCIQRFRARRKLDSTRANIFSKYLALGGVETGAKQFTGGLDRDLLENHTASEITAFQATDFIRTYPHNSKFYDGSDKWVVDFEGVAKGFFSHRLPSTFPIESERQLEDYCMVIKGFLNYVLYHKVCPEYMTDVLAARRIVDLAATELWTIHRIAPKLPGDFNKAASILFGGRYKNVWGFGYLDEVEPDFENRASTIGGFSESRAELIFMTAIAICGGKEQAAQVDCSKTFIVNTEKKFYEVVEIQHPNSHIIDQYSLVKDPNGIIGQLKPLGSVKLRYWRNPGIEQADYTDDESVPEDNELESEWYWLEDEILQDFFPGLKLEVEVKELSIGMKYIDSFVGILCSFYTYLPNEKMVNYKVPIAGTRPAPTEDDENINDKYEDDLEIEDC